MVALPAQEGCAHHGPRSRSPASWLDERRRSCLVFRHRPREGPDTGEDSTMRRLLLTTLAFTLTIVAAANAAAQTVRIGLVNTYTGPQASFGDLTDKAMKLYMKLHEKDL